ncbi:MAG TPA: DNA alkylation repair protein [Saprospiraceae bacterium]|nr:DNA alkylation repair protein [Saprospiraceae bacterium]
MALNRSYSENTLSQIKTLMQAQADPHRAARMKAYMKNHFEFLGIDSPKRKLLVKEIQQNIYSFNPSDFQTLVKELWNQPYREYQYLVFDLGYSKISKMDQLWIPFFEQLVLQKSWWDTVDGLSAHFIGLILKRNPELVEPYCMKWIEHDSFWIQRTAIICQLFFKDQCQFELLKNLILLKADSKEFFIQKACGWALRQHAKTNANQVRTFVNQYSLPKLTVREATKHIKE